MFKRLCLQTACLHGVESSGFTVPSVTCALATCMDVTRDPPTLQAHTNSVGDRECAVMYRESVDVLQHFQEFVRLAFSEVPLWSEVRIISIKKRVSLKNA